jgi:hypothetical protein
MKGTSANTNDLSVLPVFHILPLYGTVDLAGT